MFYIHLPRAAGQSEARARLGRRRGEGVRKSACVASGSPANRRFVGVSLGAEAAREYEMEAAEFMLYPLFLAAFVGVFQANIQLKNGGFCVIIIYKNGKEAKIFTVTQPFCAFSYLMGERRQKNKQVKERKKDEKRFRNERRNAR